MTYVPGRRDFDQKWWYLQPYSEDAVGFEHMIFGTTSLADAVVGAGNAGVVMYVPFRVRAPLKIAKAWVANGSAVAGNVDIGVYAEDGTLVVSTGTTAQAGTNAVQSIDVTDTVLPRGYYYMAICLSSSSARILAGGNSAGVMQALGYLEQTGVTLPLSTGASPATFAAWTRSLFNPYFGVQAERAFQ